MKQVLVSRGKASVKSIPAPMAETGRVLIRMQHSCVSIGTELSNVKATGLSLLRRVLKQPEKIQQVFKIIAHEGLSKARRLVEQRLSVELPTGYSGAGIVIAVGAGVSGFQIGDRVACAGAQCAYHAEIVSVPVKLVALMPDAINFAEAATVALGAIALQGVRRATPTLGEIFVVVGLGFLGQITVQLLRAHGCRVIGIDIDRSRLALAKTLGMEWGFHPDDPPDSAQVARLTNGDGADGVIVTAATPSSEIIATAFQLCRKKGRVVLVGDVGLDLQRADLYEKELDFLISTSYGPGRYDQRYEEQGLDYPIAYVRWTEQRNMSEYLALIASKRVHIQELITAIYPIEQASAAFAALQDQAQKPLAVLLSYPAQEAAVTRRLDLTFTQPIRSATDARISIAVIGAGNFAKDTHLPNLASMQDRFELKAIVSRTGHNAAAIAQQFGAAYCSTDFQTVLDDSTIEAVIIATRHHLHAALAIKALNAGKHVLVEKPLALHEDDLQQIELFYAATPASAKPVLLTGFNRRFSAHAQKIKALVAARTHPMMINYRMNAGYIPLDHWVHSDEGGGRNQGEACHIYDLFTYLIDAEVVDVQAQAIRPATAYYSSTDNFFATLSFADGSVAHLTYTAMGRNDYPKERMEIFFDGTIIELDDYKKLVVHGKKTQTFTSKLQDKGQKAELECFAKAIRGAGQNSIQPTSPIPLWQQFMVARIGFAVDECIGRAHEIDNTK